MFARNKLLSNRRLINIAIYDLKGALLKVQREFHCRMYVEMVHQAEMGRIEFQFLSKFVAHKHSSVCKSIRWLLCLSLCALDFLFTYFV